MRCPMEDSARAAAVSEKEETKFLAWAQGGRAGTQRQNGSDGGQANAGAGGAGGL